MGPPRSRSKSKRKTTSNSPDEERAAKAAAEAYYEEDGCDGDCDNCEHYDWCPAEEEDEDNKVLFKGVTQGRDVKNGRQGGVEFAREE